MKNNKFVFVSPMYNASKTLSRMLHSICGQSYDNWEIHLIDDVSGDDEQNKCKEIINCFQHMLDVDGKNSKKIKVTWNSESRGKRWEMSNVLYGINTCDDEDIICRIDADDYLCDMDALLLVNQIYNQTSCEAAWSMHRWGKSDRNISNSLRNDVSVYEQPWVSSHLKTFRKRLINNIPYENFVNMNGDLVKRAGDQALYLPILHRSKRNIFIPRPLYGYTIDEMNGAVYQTDDAKFQKSEADFIRSRGYVVSGDSWENFIS